MTKQWKRARVPCGHQPLERGRRPTAVGSMRALAMALLATAAWGAPGQADPRFAAGGIAIHDLGFNETGAAVALQKDGKIVSVGLGFDPASGTDGFLLERLNADGSRDPTFGQDGVVLTPIDDRAFAVAVAIQKDGKVLAAGGATLSLPGVTTRRFALARYNPAGDLDLTFATRAGPLAPAGR